MGLKQSVMKPIARQESPVGDEWVYEVKYDGFRCVLDWDGQTLSLTSKHNKDLTPQFPEVVQVMHAFFAAKDDVKSITLDGELVILNNPYQGNFSLLQKRGRMKTEVVIQEAARQRPATFMAFDILFYNGDDFANKMFFERKEMLKAVIADMHNNQAVQGLSEIIAYVPAKTDMRNLWNTIFDFKGEGMITKRTKSIYHQGKKHYDWFKIKNWRTVTGVLTAYDPSNGYFTVSVNDEQSWIPIGKCKHGLDDTTKKTLQMLFQEDGIHQNGALQLPPAIAATIHTLDMTDAELREPEFVLISPLTERLACTVQQLELNLAMLPQTVDLSNTDKPFWPDADLTKGDLLVYMREVSPYMLPFLKQRALTLIRFPDGVNGTHFFQKHLPDYAPEFIPAGKMAGKKVILCDGLDALIWFANHGAIEYHIPFQTFNEATPSDIVFDLDPPNRGHFQLAVYAAHLIKRLIDGLELEAFVKTSGNKGLQIHIPLPDNRLTYDDTAIFTEALAKTIEQAEPDLFTTERMKDKRNGRLYIDYVQHGKDKTIIAPYSPRSTGEATVATPLFWEELNEELRPEQFTIKNVVKRIQTLGCPWAHYFKAGTDQRLDALEKLIAQ
ncbi:DNA ligase D [Lentibacillus saliphilus]|uniref:DNA ligase D n=1 Tax=Lentibacillus saliphilus TaxID=2737028 RepID=UPI001FEB2B89|nr:DNA ligase D [Lentibacillus saliphilus]